MKILQFKENWLYEIPQTASTTDKEKTEIHSIKYLYPEVEQATTSAHHGYSLDPCRHTDFGINMRSISEICLLVNWLCIEFIIYHYPAEPKPDYSTTSAWLQLGQTRCDVSLKVESSQSHTRTTVLLEHF